MNIVTKGEIYHFNPKLVIKRGEISERRSSPNPVIS